MSRWAILHAYSERRALAEDVIAASARRAVITAVEKHGLDPGRGYVARLLVIE